uniref:diacylglycerol O-acyltransferase n=1 Tax=bacterium enrichment culture TaxID=207831 RepID=A0A0R7N6G8_9BACT|nr:wax ester synthase-like Acyl-CoA acyltransferase [bacterium enrichment culture]
MEQLSGTDSYFLYTERGNNYNHVAALGIYDPSTAPGGMVRYKDILQYFSRRLDINKVFRRRLVTVPHEFDRPYWVDDADLDLEFHIRHIALPEPGDWRQLMIQVARLHSRPLDRSRPLWEIYVVGGLDKIPGLPVGSFALFLKFHHASVDGQAGAALLKAVHSLSPTPDDDGHPRSTIYAERDPTSVELYTRAVAHGVVRTGSISKLYLNTLSKVAGLTIDQIARQLKPGDPGAAAAATPPGFVKAPATRFNGLVSANRVVEAVGLPLDAMQRARTRIDDITINDLFLAIVGGALRKYLAAKEELPAKSLTALMPMSVRQEGKPGKGGNEVGGVPVPLRTDVADPVGRLLAVRADAQAAKRGSETMGRGFLKSILDDLPNFASEAFMRYAVYPQLNVTVSNVRGPDVPLYMSGARLVHFYPVSIASDHIGLNHTGFSYNGVMWITAVACRNMMPDPAFYAECLRGSFDELMAAIDARPSAAHPPAPGGKPARIHAVTAKRRRAKPVAPPPVSPRARATAKGKMKTKTKTRTQSGAKARGAPAVAKSKKRRG